MVFITIATTVFQMFFVLFTTGNVAMSFSTTDIITSPSVTTRTGVTGMFGGGRIGRKVKNFSFDWKTIISLLDER
jgi:hypothetical protein